MPKKLERCVKEVQKKGYDKNSAYPICISSIKKGEKNKTKKKARK